MKFKLHDIRESKVWQVTEQAGVVKERKRIIQKCLAKGMTHKQIAEFLKIRLAEVRQLAADAQGS
jgi:DNA-binding NarL/FixJ family response regulator